MANDRLTIGLFLEHYDPFISGVITATKALKRELESRGHKVYIVCPRVKGFNDKDPSVIRTRSFSHPALQNTTIGLPLPGDAKKLAKLRFDVIHSKEVFYNGGLGLVVARQLGVPFIQHYHTLWNRFLDHYRFPFYVYPVALVSAVLYYPPVFGLKASGRLFFGRTPRRYGRSLPARFLWRHMLNVGAKADLAISPSAHLITVLEQAGLTTPIEHLPNGILPAPASKVAAKPSKGLRVLSVARLSPEKRVHVLIEAIAKAPQAQLEIVGVGPTENELRRLSEQLGLTSRVKFSGELSNEAVRRRMASADVLALASYGFDNQPVVFAEALAAGLPIVYCDPNLKEGLSASNSLLVPKTAEGFSQGFKKLRDKRKRLALAAASRQEVKDFDVRQTADKLLSLYHQALDNYRSR